MTGPSERGEGGLSAVSATCPAVPAAQLAPVASDTRPGAGECRPHRTAQAEWQRKPRVGDPSFGHCLLLQTARRKRARLA